MSWDDAYNQLKQELGRGPIIDEVQQRMLEMAASRLTCDINNRENKTE